MEWKPMITPDEVDRPVFEWWNGEREIAMYPMEGMLLKVWGANINTEMEEVSLHKADAVIAAFKWLEDGMPNVI